MLSFLNYAETISITETPDEVIDATCNDVSVFQPVHPKPNKKQKIAACSTRYARTVNPHTGRYKVIVLRCGYKRECPVCRELAGDKLRKSLQNVKDEKGVWVGVYEEEEAAEITRELEKKDYRRFPDGEGNVTLVYRGENMGDEPFTTAQWESLDYNELVVAPKGKRNSGSLGSGKVASSESKVKVKVVVAPTASLKEWDKAAKAAVACTPNLNPRNLWQLEDAMDKRVNALCDQLKSMGIRYFVTRSTLPFDQDRLHWMTDGSYMERDFL